MKMRYRALFVALAASMAAVVLGGCATGKSNNRPRDRDLDIDGITYRISTNNEGKQTAAVIKMFKRPKNLTIPSAVYGYPVTVIGGVGPKGPLDNIGLESVTIPESVTTILAGAFAGNKLTSVIIPDSVTFIESEAFMNNQLTSVTISNNVRTIGSEAFGNNKLESVTIPGSVTRLSGFNKNQLTSVTIPGSVTHILNNAFTNNLLTSVTIPGNVIDIQRAAFFDNRLTSITIPGSVTSIGQGAFQHNRLESVTIPRGVTSVGWAAFSNNRLTSVTVSGSATKVDSYAFGFNPLEQVTITSGLPRNKVNWAAFGSLTPALWANDGRAGVYTRTESGWLWNGEPLPAYAGLLAGSGIQILKIDRGNPAQYEVPGTYGNGTAAYLLPAGEHTIEATYDTRNARGYGKWSEGSVTFNERYLFEDTNYALTGDLEKQPGMIVFAIKRDGGN